MPAPLAIALSLAAVAIAGSPPETDWVLVKSKGRDVAVHPKSGEQRELPSQDPPDLSSPDGTRVIFLGTPKGGDTFDLLIADLSRPADPDSPPTKSNIRTLLSGTPGFRDFSWTADGSHILFLADTPTARAQVFLVSTKPGATPTTPNVPRQVSDSSGPCFNPRAAADGRVAWGIHREQRGKEPIYDLVISDGKSPGELAAATVDPFAPRPAPPASDRPRQQQLADVPAPPPAPKAVPPARTIPLRAEASPLKFDVFAEDINLWSFEFSPDASKLAYASGTSLFVHTFATKTTAETRFAEVHKDLYAHGMHHMSWRRDGRVLAGFVTFLGGRSAPLNAAPGEEFSMLGDREVFFFPMTGKPWWATRPAPASGVEWIEESKLPKVAP
jgi:hypothetical protein